MVLPEDTETGTLEQTEDERSRFATKRTLSGNTEGERNLSCWGRDGKKGRTYRRGRGRATFGVSVLPVCVGPSGSLLDRLLDYVDHNRTLPVSLRYDNCVLKRVLNVTCVESLRLLCSVGCGQL